MGITLTERAAKQVKRLFEEHKANPTACLRVGIKGGGCSGFSYVLNIADAPAADDEVFASHDVKLLCDPKSYLYLNGTEIDFKDELMGGGFVFNNPNAKDKCSCGASFSA
jgi:iron-sulfur cluster assembly protein